jgi:hypothetical protein
MTITGEVLFSGIVAAEIPEEVSFRFAVYDQDGECRVVYERERVYSTFTLPMPQIEAVLAAVSAIIPSPADRGGANSYGGS